MRIRKIIRYAFLLVAILNINLLKVNAAASKEIPIELQNDYLSCSFKLEFSELGDYSAKLVYPQLEVNNEPKEVDFSVIDESNMVCNVSKCKAGNYRVVITSQEAESSEEICKVKVLTEATKEKEADIADSIKIGKDISGLKMFFIDDELNVTWTDDSCGNVTVEVTNTTTNEIISNENIKDKVFTCEIPEDIGTITVSVVPTESSKISDAIQSYNLQIDREPKGNVLFEDVEYTNKKSITANMKTEKKYGCEVYVNDKKVVENGIMDIGSHEFNIPIESESNNIVFYLVDETGNKYSFCTSVIQDTVCPSITLNEEYDGIQTNKNEITLIGKVSDFDSFKVNNIEYSDIATDGQFEVQCNLHIGENKISLVAVDKAGNKTEYIANIEMVESKSSPIGFIVIGILLVLILILIFRKRIRFSKKDKNTNAEDAAEVENETEETDDAENEFNNELDYVPDEDDNFEEEEEMTLEEYEALQKKAEKTKKDNKEIIKTLIHCVIIVFFLKFIVSIFIIPTSSMSPTVHAGDMVAVNDLAYLSKEPQRGDIVVFKSDEFKIRMNKRIIGIPGDVISFMDGFVCVNGEKIDESHYIGEDIETNGLGLFVVPEDSYFMLGDNREDSMDSRFWENPFIKSNKIYGKMLFVIPVSKVTSILAQ